MGLIDRFLGREQRSGIPAAAEQRSIEDPTYNLSENPEALLKMLGVLDRNNALPVVSI